MDVVKFITELLEVPEELIDIQKGKNGKIGFSVLPMALYLKVDPSELAMVIKCSINANKSNLVWKEGPKDPFDW